MALTESNMLSLGTKAPAFNLPDTVSGRSLSFDDVKGKNGTIVVFSCNHCPFVVHVNAELVALAHDHICMMKANPWPSRMMQHARQTYTCLIRMMRYITEEDWMGLDQEMMLHWREKTSEAPCICYSMAQMLQQNNTQVLVVTSSGSRVSFFHYISDHEQEE